MTKGQPQRPRNEPHGFACSLSQRGARIRRGGDPNGSGVGECLSPDVGVFAVPFKLNQECRHHIPRQQHKVTNWPAYEAGLRQRGSLTVWFTDEAVAAWTAAPRTSRGGQPFYSPLAILTALTLRAVFHLAYRQAEGLIGSIISLLGLTLRVPDHTTLSRRSATLAVPRPQLSTDASDSAQALHLLVDSTGLKLCGAGEWLIEKHGTRARRSWRKLHLGVDAGTGQIVASALTSKEMDDAAQVGPLLDQVTGLLTSVTADGAYDQDGVYDAIAERHRDTAVIVPPRRTAVLSDKAATAPTQRDRHLQCIAETSRRAWQKVSGYNKRAKVEAAIGRWKQVIGDGLRSRTDERRVTEVNVAVDVLNRMLELGRPNYVRIV
jgi:transposase